MKANLEVLTPGLFSTIQDAGRFGFQNYGVPQSGVMDNYAFKIANMLLGNDENSAVLEMTMMGPKLKFKSSTTICISGAELSPKLNSTDIELYKAIKIAEGDILEFGKRKSGFRSYLAVAGGFVTEKVLESRSWYDGLTEDQRLKKGMLLSFGSDLSHHQESFSSLKILDHYIHSNIIDTYKGPEYDHLTDEQKNIIQSGTYHIGEDSNRMAIQLKEHLQNELAPIITSPVLPGTVQLTPSGNLIILAKDCQITGGYPRILQLSEEGQRTLSQKLPGEEIRFKLKEY